MKVAKTRQYSPLESMTTDFRKQTDGPVPTNPKLGVQLVRGQFAEAVDFVRDCLVMIRHCWFLTVTGHFYRRKVFADYFHFYQN